MPRAANEMGLKKLPSVKSLQTEYAALLSEKKAAYTEYREAREEMKRLHIYRATRNKFSASTPARPRRKKEREQR